MKIAIVKLSAMGDIIHAMVALQYIKKQKPTLQIDWIVEEGFKQILENNPDIDNILTVNLKSIKKNKLALLAEIKKIKTYAQNNYDLVIDAQGLLKSAISAKLLGNTVVGFSKASIREGIASLFYNETVNIDYSANAIERNAKILGKPLAVNISKEKILKKEPFLHFNNQNPLPIQIDNYVLFVVGASKANKIYPKELFLEVAQQLNEKVLVIWANEYEKEVAGYLDNTLKNVTASPKLNLDQLKRVVSESKLVIGGDTGPTHMAWALNIPSVTIFGNTPEHRNTYLTSINRVVKSKSFVDPLNLDKNDFSISEIEPQEIVNSAKELLA
jgi:heptosyltransferase-1